MQQIKDPQVLQKVSFDTFQVPQSRIHRKLRQLVECGLLECFRGNGYFVRPGRPAAEVAA